MMNPFNMIYEAIALSLTLIYGVRLLLIDENPLLWKVMGWKLKREGTLEDFIGPEYKIFTPHKKYSLLELATNNNKSRPVIKFSGRVTDLNGKALSPPPEIHVWHPDENGHYSILGYDCRGIITCDAEGYYKFETVVPRYITFVSAIFGPNSIIKDKPSNKARPAHFHIYITQNGKHVLTTQLYFEGGKDVVHEMFKVPTSPPELKVTVQKHDADSSSKIPYSTGSFDFRVNAHSDRNKAQ